MNKQDRIIARSRGIPAVFLDRDGTIIEDCGDLSGGVDVAGGIREGADIVLSGVGMTGE